MKHILHATTLLIATLSALGLQGCGGGSGSDASAHLSGTAAVGAALPGATVTARCASGPELTGTTAGDGHFDLTLSGNQTLPCVLRVTGGSPTVTLHSLATAAGRVNITPLTELVLARATGGLPATLFETPDANALNSAAGALGTAKTRVGDDLVAAGLSRPGIDPMTGTFAIGDAEDQILDALGTRLAEQELSLEELALASAEDGLSEALGNGAGSGSGGGGSSATAESIFGRHRVASDMSLLTELSGTMTNRTVGGSPDCSYNYNNGTLTVVSGSTTISATFNGDSLDMATASGQQFTIRAVDGVANTAGYTSIQLLLFFQSATTPIWLSEVSAIQNVDGTNSVGMYCTPASGSSNSTALTLQQVGRSVGTLAFMDTYPSGSTPWKTLTANDMAPFAGTYTGLANGGSYERTCNSVAQANGCTQSYRANLSCSMTVNANGTVSLTVDGGQPSTAISLIGQTAWVDIMQSLRLPADSSIQGYVKAYKLDLPGGLSDQAYIRWADASFYEGPVTIAYTEAGATSSVSNSTDKITYTCTFRQ